VGGAAAPPAGPAPSRVSTGPRYRAGAVPEAYISVDVETAGPVPRTHALLSLGACLVDDPRVTYYAEMQPASPEFDPAALAVSGLSLDRLAEHGLAPEEAMRGFAAWVEEVVPGGSRPVFVAFNAPFDWMFVADYFRRFGVANPFGHAALDIKALYMGVTGETWGRTTMADVGARYGLSIDPPHHALEDALVQANLFRRILAEGAARRSTEEPAT
jgi:DNA polymerase III epsilon subunit-like protein